MDECSLKQECDTVRPAMVLDRAGLAALVVALWNRCDRVVGPTPRDGVIVYDTLHAIDELPCGQTDQHGPGRYRLVPRADAALLGYTVGPHSWKQFLYPPVRALFTARKVGATLCLEPAASSAQQLALFGVRACDMAAIARHDRILIDGPYADGDYALRRAHLFIVAVHCTEPGQTCFCASLDAGPRVQAGFDLALTEMTELPDGAGHGFLLEIGSQAGAELVAEIPTRLALAAEVAKANEAITRAAGKMGRHLATADLKERLFASPEHPSWDDVAERCLACGNCTMVCPTCFCTSVEDASDLARQSASRIRKWDSCFSLNFTALHGGSVRQSTRARYRQWMTHKLAGWVDQFGTSGCVGCGRCMTWCPVGIDITEQAASILASAQDSDKEVHATP